MNNTNDNIKKICNFYLSDWHFTVMMLPYINQEVNSKTQIITIFEKDMTQKIKTLVEKLNLKNKDKILEINWGKLYTKDLNKLIKNINEYDKNLLIIKGSNNYVKEINKKVSGIINSNNYNNKKIKIIDCYDFESNKENISTIIKNYNSILNTSGENEIKNIRYNVGEG